MVDRIPSGTRDVLPDEMGELRAMTDRVREVFEHAGYGEVYTPALEYESTFERAAVAATRLCRRLSPTEAYEFAGIERLTEDRYRSASRPEENGVPWLIGLVSEQPATVGR